MFTACNDLLFSINFNILLSPTMTVELDYYALSRKVRSGALTKEGIADAIVEFFMNYRYLLNISDKDTSRVYHFYEKAEYLIPDRETADLIKTKFMAQYKEIKEAAKKELAEKKFQVSSGYGLCVSCQYRTDCDWRSYCDYTPI